MIPRSVATIVDRTTVGEIKFHIIISEIYIGSKRPRTWFEAFLVKFTICFLITVRFRLGRLVLYSWEPIFGFEYGNYITKITYSQLGRWLIIILPAGFDMRLATLF
jgi:hypothetical protein